MTTRRSFIVQSGLAVTAALIKPDFLFAKSPYKVGIQLFSLRDQIGNDLKGLIAKTAKAGYQELETFGFDKQKGFFGSTPKEFKQILANNGMTTPSGHYGIDGYLNGGSDSDLKTIVEAAKTLGQTYLTIPSLGSDLRKTADGCKKLALRMNQAAEISMRSGIKLAYHNHNFEFELVEGTTLYNVLLKETDPKLVSFEMDIYWVVRAGQDPIKMIESHPGRFHMWHVKDMDKNNHELNTEIGNGTIDYKKIFTKAKLSGLQHIFMEQENFTNIDPYKSITQSATYIKTKLL